MTPTVVLLHGLGRTHRSLGGLRRHLERAGWSTWARTYPSRRLSIVELAAWVAERIREDLGDAPLLGVTHSLGGIVVRHLADQLPWHGVVMLAPPNAGSRVATALREHASFRWFFGPAGIEVADPTSWPQPPRPFGVIAGTRGPSLGNPPSWAAHSLGLLPRDAPHDGTVTVAETRLPGMAAFAEVEASHTWVMDHPRTRELVVRFLAEGSFSADC